MSSYLDTRDLLDELDSLQATIDAAEEEDTAPDADDVERRDAIHALVDEIGEQAMRDGDAGPLVPEDSWTEYAEELADDLYGDTIRNAGWPMRHIDWEAAARELSVDYGTVTFDGTEYYYRMT